MPIRDFHSQRLFVKDDLSRGTEIACDANQSSYLAQVLRTVVGDPILLFNGRDGEWRGRITRSHKRGCRILLEERTRTQAGGPDIIYAFALLKRIKPEALVQKATELGVAWLQPMTTDHTQIDRINMARLEANVIEAAEQCGILRLPVVEPLRRLSDVLEQWQADRLLVFCDEGAEVANPIEALAGYRAEQIGVLIGPEGGFSNREREQILSRANVVRLSLGPRVMRADTAGIAALALINATLGDWR